MPTTGWLSTYLKVSPMKRSDIPKCALSLSLTHTFSHTLSHTHSHSQSAFRPALETVPAHFNFNFSIVRSTYFLTLVMIILHLIVVLLRLTVASRGKIKLADCSTYEILQPQAFTLTHSHTLSLIFSCSQAHTHTKQIKLTQRCAPLHSSSRYFAEKVMRTLLHSHSFPNTRSHTPAHSRTYELSRTCASCRILRRFHFRVTSSPFINISRKKIRRKLEVILGLVVLRKKAATER